MTDERFVHRLETDAAYRAHLLAANKAGRLTEEEILDLMQCAWGEPPRRWANTLRTSPWPAVLLSLYVEHRATPFPTGLTTMTCSREVADAWAVRCEAARRLRDPRWCALRPQLKEVIALLDERYEGTQLGVDET